MKKFLIIVVLCILLCGCGTSYSKEFDINQLMSENEYIIVDVRTKDEYDEAHLVDAVNIPYDEIQSDIFDKDKIIFVYCRSGNRSKIAYDYLNSLGYTVYDLGAFERIDLPKE